jgi:hypothetical protein
VVLSRNIECATAAGRGTAAAGARGARLGAVVQAPGWGRRRRRGGGRGGGGGAWRGGDGAAAAAADSAAQLARLTATMQEILAAQAEFARVQQMLVQAVRRRAVSIHLGMGPY